MNTSPFSSFSLHMKREISTIVTFIYTACGRVGNELLVFRYDWFLVRVGEWE